MPRKKPLVCCVPYCETREKLYGDDDDDVKLYKFPSEKPLMRKWVAQIGRGGNFIPTERSRICTKHFQSGRKSYKPTNVDYIPTIFWYNTVKNSEFCTGCRRKVCKCEKNETKQKVVDSKGIDFSETEMFQLLHTIEAEEEALDSQDLNPCFDLTSATDSESLGNRDHNESSMAIDSLEIISIDQSADSDVTTAIASFLADEYIPEEDFSSTHEHILPDDLHHSPLERTNVDDTIDRCVRAEDSVGEDILLRQFRREILSSEEVTIEAGESGLTSGVIEDKNILGLVSICMDSKLGGISNSTLVSILPCQSDTFMQVEEPHPPVSDPGKTKPESINDLKLDPNKMYLELCPDSEQVGHPDSELEREWKRRERKLVKQHKTEEKKMVLEIMRNNQAKNQVIDELKRSVKELKKEKKAIQSNMDSLDKKLQEEYESRRLQDTKNLLTEANSNLVQLQSRWTDEKRILMEANSALAKLCKGEEVNLTQLQADFISSILAAPSSSSSEQQHQQNSVGEVEQRLHDIQNRIGGKLLRYEYCAQCPETVKYFTGMPTADDFDNFYSFLEEKAKSMRYWNGKTWSVNPTVGKRLKTHRIDHKNQLFLTLTRYKRGFTTKELGYFFSVDPVYISLLFITFSKLIENELIELFQHDYDSVLEFSNLPEIVQTHYPKLYATLRVVEIRLENRPTFASFNAKLSPNKKVRPTFKLIFLCTPNAQVFFISPVFPGSTTDREVILESKVLDMIPAGSEVFVDKEFDVSNECIQKHLQLHVFPQEAAPHTLSEDDPWEIKLMIKCKSRIEKLVGLMRYFRIFDNELHFAGANHSPTVIRVVLLLQNYFDTRCTTSLGIVDQGSIILIGIGE